MSLRFKRNYHLIVKLALFALILALGMGTQRIVSYSVPDGAAAAQLLAASPIQVAVQSGTLLEMQETSSFVEPALQQPDDAVINSIQIPDVDGQEY